MEQLRSADRDSLLLLATMRVADQAEPQRIKVRNLSSGGMMAECPVRTVRGERLRIDLRNLGWVNGTVAWVTDNRFGVVFDREIDFMAVRQPVIGSGDIPGIYTRLPARARQPDPGALRWI